MTTDEFDDGIIGAFQRNWKNLIIGTLCWLCLFSFIVGYRCGAREQMESIKQVMPTFLAEQRALAISSVVNQANGIKKNRTYSEWKHLKFRASEWGVSVTF